MLQVCGSDDKTYTSRCAAGCANIAVKNAGACVPVDNSARSLASACFIYGSHLMSPQLLSLALMQPCRSREGSGRMHAI